MDWAEKESCRENEEPKPGKLACEGSCPCFRFYCAGNGELLFIL